MLLENILKAHNFITTNLRNQILFGMSESVGHTNFNFHLMKSDEKKIENLHQLKIKLLICLLS